jgi:hypothetical protein
MENTQSFSEICAAYHRRSRWDQETATYCCALCYRHSGATSSSSSFLPAQARPVLRACFRCRAKCCGGCTSVVEIGKTIKAAFAAFDTYEVLGELRWFVTYWWRKMYQFYAQFFGDIKGWKCWIGGRSAKHTHTECSRRL